MRVYASIYACTHTHKHTHTHITSQTHPSRLALLIPPFLIKASVLQVYSSHSNQYVSVYVCTHTHMCTYKLARAHTHTHTHITSQTHLSRLVFLIPPFLTKPAILQVYSRHSNQFPAVTRDTRISIKLDVIQ